MSTVEALRLAIINPLLDLAAARERMMAYPDACPEPRGDVCPDCGAFPGILPGHAYRAWLPSGVRCTSTWHDRQGGAL